jgi:hypothetical protein
VIIPVANLAPRNVDAVAAQTTVDEGDLVSLSASFTDPGSADTHSFLWKVSASNGLTVADGTSQDFSFTAADSGDYLITLTVTDDDGGSKSDTVFVSAENVAPTVDLGADFGVDEGDAVSLMPTVTDPAGANDALTYVWEVVSTNTQSVPGSSAEDLGFTPTDNGTYTVTLTVTDDDGGVGSDTMVITASNADPVVDASGNLTLSEGGTFDLTGSFTDPGSDFWTVTVDYGDGFSTPVVHSAKAFSDDHVYADDGTYNVVVTVLDDDGGSDFTELVVTVDNVAPVLDVSGGYQSTAGEVYTLNLDASDPGTDTISQWEIDWGDGTVDTISGAQDTADHTYTDPMPMTGDLDGDGDVDGTDAVLFMQQYNTSGADLAADLNDDGNVDAADAALFGPNYGKSGWGSYTISVQATDEDGTYTAETSVAVEPAPSGGAAPMSLPSAGADVTLSATTEPLTLSVSAPVVEEPVETAAVSALLSAPVQDATAPATTLAVSAPEEEAPPAPVSLEASGAEAVRTASSGSADRLQQLAMDESFRRMETMRNIRSHGRLPIDLTPGPGAPGTVSAPSDMRIDVFGRSGDGGFFDYYDDGRPSWADGFLNNLAEYDDGSDDDKIEIEPVGEEEATPAEGSDWLSGWLAGDDKAVK